MNDQHRAVVMARQKCSFNNKKASYRKWIARTLICSRFRG